MKDGDEKRRTRFKTFLGHDAEETPMFVDVGYAKRSRQQSEMAACVTL